MWGILGFAAVFFITALSSVSNQFYAEVRFDEVQNGVKSYYLCMYAGGTDQFCQSLLYKWSPGLYWWGIITISSIGVYAYVLFGLSKRRVRLRWCRAFKNVVDGKDFSDWSDD
eukprot:TRINITY_DN5825_c0_g1_i2.p1 TRINITY_DN5825_c0_g1~~TRINITY_DN5825_c0_g1_i2.p1  ORF type:complete len:113 (+),score=10.47 TRINITY_DN5825_c0_g1_i2:332-670(+)